MPLLAERSMASKASDTHCIAFSVTDGDSSRWPTNTRPPAPSSRTVNWLRKMTVGEKHSCRWRSHLGKGIAKLLNKPDDEKYCLQSFPDGYWLFDHNKGPPSDVRHDLYLYGSKHVHRFRSPQEFIPHGYWLLTDPTLNRKNCGCKYCGKIGKTQSEISSELGLRTNEGPATATRLRIRGGVKSQSLRSPARISNATTSMGSWVPREKRSSPQIDPKWKVTSSRLNLAANAARIFDLRTKRTFRMGELVWCWWQPEIPGNFEKQDFKVDRQLWPAVVINYCLDISVNHLPPLGRESITQSRKYALRRLGTQIWERDVEYECTLSEDEILPWHAHKVDPSHMSSSADHASTPDPVLVSYRLALEAAQSLVNFWAVCDRIPVKVPLSPDFAHAADNNSDRFRYSSAASCITRDARNSSHSSCSTPARYMSYSVEPTPSQRSPTRLVPASAAYAATTKHPSVREHPLIESAAAVMVETRYQGLWYGAERIWTGDLVRLAPERQAFSQSLQLSSITHDWLQKSFLLPKGAESLGGVLMRIDKIFARIGETGAKECAVAGPIYEMVPNDLERHAAEGSNVSSSVRAQTIPSYLCEPTYPWNDPEHPDDESYTTKKSHTFNYSPTLLPPPKYSGYVLRPLLPPGFEIPIPVAYIAGRYYPDILESSLLNSVPPKIPKDMRSMDELMLVDRRAVELLSLCALAPGRYNQTECIALRLANRSEMLREAMRVATAEDEGDKKHLDAPIEFTTTSMFNRYT